MNDASNIDLVWVAVSVYMIVLVGYGSYLLRGWIRMRREHRDAWERYENSHHGVNIYYDSRTGYTSGRNLINKEEESK
tara:strand:+ start:1708 stop:1941 length:234 start_codon:yes stop_codon:yes gene_type:complete